MSQIAETTGGDQVVIKKITVQELATHCSERDLWIAFEGKVSFYH